MQVKESKDHQLGDSEQRFNLSVLQILPLWIGGKYDKQMLPVPCAYPLSLSQRLTSQFPHVLTACWSLPEEFPRWECSRLQDCWKYWKEQETVDKPPAPRPSVAQLQAGSRVPTCRKQPGFPHILHGFLPSTLLLPHSLARASGNHLPNKLL